MGKKMKRFSTDYRGVFYIEGKAIGSNKPEKIFYISYYKNGKRIEEKAGRQYADDMTPAKANRQRSQKIEGNIPTNQEKRDAKKAEEEAKIGRWTIDRLWEEYKKQRKPGKGLDVDTNRYKLHLKNTFGDKEPQEILALDVNRLRINLLKKKSPQTVKHVLNLLTWIINYGVKTELCQCLSFHVKKPTVNNQKTEDLSPEQLKKLLDTLDKSSNIHVANMMKMALYTGMRKGELFKLEWRDIDFDRGFITIRDPKGGVDSKIPLNDAARKLLKNHPKVEKSKYVFPGEGGDRRATMQQAVNKIRKDAELPSDFRPMHGLRHVFASMMASSGQVSMYVLAKLLNHRDQRMTERYAHLRDESLRKASNLAGDIINQALEKKTDVVDLKKS